MNEKETSVIRIAKQHLEICELRLRRALDDYERACQALTNTVLSAEIKKCCE